MRNPLIIILFVIATAALVLLFGPKWGEQAVTAQANPANPAAVILAGQEGESVPTPQPLLPDEAPQRLEIVPQGNYVIDVVLHSYEEIEELLDKAEASVIQPRPAGAKPSIALVLHGPEVDLFSIKNYPKYRSLVDRAARLDAYNVIEVKMCQTSMRVRGVRNEDVPGFIELVPFGPDEIKRLQQHGYVKI